MRTKFRFDEEIELYFNHGTGYRWNHAMWGLLANADRVINDVYLFKHFEDYCRQLESGSQKDKQEVYWAASYHQKLIDYIKIIVAFETMNKALLIKSGFLVHKIDHLENKSLHRRQAKGIPITLDEFYRENFTSLDWIRCRAKLNGLTPNRSTINFTHTLNKQYQEILQLDEDLVLHLKEINMKRNRLHFYSDFTGAFEVNRHITKWKFIKEQSQTTIRKEFLKIDEVLKNHP